MARERKANEGEKWSTDGHRKPWAERMAVLCQKRVLGLVNDAALLKEFGEIAPNVVKLVQDGAIVTPKGWVVAAPPKAPARKTTTAVTGKKGRAAK